MRFPGFSCPGDLSSGVGGGVRLLCLVAGLVVTVTVTTGFRLSVGRSSLVSLAISSLPPRRDEIAACILGCSVVRAAKLPPLPLRAAAREKCMVA